MREIAKSRGGKCLSDKYVNGKIKLRWKCKEGHLWSASPANVTQHNSWCRKCSAKRRREQAEETI